MRGSVGVSWFAVKCATLCPLHRVPGMRASKKPRAHFFTGYLVTFWGSIAPGQIGKQEVQLAIPKFDPRTCLCIFSPFFPRSLLAVIYYYLNWCNSILRNAHWKTRTKKFLANGLILTCVFCLNLRLLNLWNGKYTYLLVRSYVHTKASGQTLIYICIQHMRRGKTPPEWGKACLGF